MPVKISELSSSAQITANDVLPFVDDSTLSTKKISAEKVLEYITGSTFNTLTVTSLTSSNITASRIDVDQIYATDVIAENISGDASGLTNIAAAGIQGSIQYNESNLITGDSYLTYDSENLKLISENAQFVSATVGDISGTIASFTIVSASNVNISGDLFVSGVLTATEYHTTVVSASIIYESGSTKFGDDSTDTHQFSGSILLSGTLAANNTISGTTAQFAVITGSTVTGSTALFTTVSASKAEISGNLVIHGSASLAEYPDYAYVLYTASYDKIVVYPGLYVSGNLTGSGLGAFQTLSASTYLGLPTSSGGTPGGTNTTIQFNSGSTFSGSSNLIWDYVSNTLNIGTSSNSTSTINLLANNIENNSAGDVRFVKRDGWLLSLNEVYSTGSNAAYHSPQFILQKSRGTPSSPTAVQNGDQVGGFFYRAYDGTTHKQRAGISAWVDGTVVNNTDVPMRLRFFAGTTEGENTDERFAVARNEVVVNNYSQSVDFRVEGVTDQNLLFVSGSIDRVGIGTSTPNTKLDVSGVTRSSITTTGAILSAHLNNASSGDVYGEIQIGNTANSRMGAVSITGVGYSAGNGYAASSVNLLAFDDANKLTIGHTNSNGKIVLYTGDTTTGLTSGEGNARTTWYGPTTGTPGVVFNEPGNNYDFRVESVSDANMLFVSAGLNRVGIGTSTPNAKLDVNGSAIISGNLTVTGSIFVSGSSIYGQVAEITSSTTNYTLTRLDSGKFLNINSGSAVTVTVPAGLPTGFTISLCQLGSGQVTVSGSVGVTINNRQSHTKTAGQYAVVSLVGTSADTYVFVGDTTI